MRRRGRAPAALPARAAAPSTGSRSFRVRPQRLPPAPSGPTTPAVAARRIAERCACRDPGGVPWARSTGSPDRYCERGAPRRVSPPSGPFRTVFTRSPRRRIVPARGASGHADARLQRLLGPGIDGRAAGVRGSPRSGRRPIGRRCAGPVLLTAPQRRSRPPPRRSPPDAHERARDGRPRRQVPSRNSRAIAARDPFDFRRGAHRDVPTCDGTGTTPAGRVIAAR